MIYHTTYFWIKPTFFLLFLLISQFSSADELSWKQWLTENEGWYQNHDKKHRFMVYDHELKDFDLHFKLKVNPNAPSFTFGTLFRSQIDRENHSPKGYKLSFSSATDSKSTGQLLFNDSKINFAKDAKLDLLKDEWNEIRIICSGGRVQISLNKQKVADLFDGEIAYQAKGKVAFYLTNKNANMISLRDLKIKQLQAPHIPQDEWELLLDKQLTKWDVGIFAPRDKNTEDFTFPISKDDSKSLASWEYAFKKRKAFEIGTDLSREFSTYINDQSELILKLDGRVKGFLATKKAYKNYHFQAYHRWPQDKSKGGKGGIFYHAKRLSNDRNPPNLEYQHAYGNYGSLIPLMGYKANMRSVDPRNEDGSAIISDKNKRFYRVDYNPRGEKIGLKPVLDNKGKIIHKGYGFRSFNTEHEHGEWNLVEYYCYEDKTIHLVNGKVVCAGEDMLDDEGKPLTQGLILLESEWAGGAYKDVRVRSIEGFPEVYKQEVGF